MCVEFLCQRKLQRGALGAEHNKGHAALSQHTSVRVMFCSLDTGKGSFLDQAFTQLKTASLSKTNVDGSLPYGSDLYVICAEIALEVSEPYCTLQLYLSFCKVIFSSNTYSLSYLQMNVLILVINEVCSVL